MWALVCRSHVVVVVVAAAAAVDVVAFLVCFVLLVFVAFVLIGVATSKSATYY